MSNTLLRASAATMAYAHGQIKDKELFANQFMKNKKGTTEKHYIMDNWGATTSLRYSMGLYNLFGNAGDEEKMAVKDFVDNNPLPTVEPGATLEYVKQSLAREDMEGDNNLVNHLQPEEITSPHQPSNHSILGMR